jgi:hypothetical protein
MTRKTEMPQTEVAPSQDPGTLIESVVTKGDLAKLSPQERTQYYVEVCRSVGLNPFTRPFEYIILNGKLILYARRDAADQLRKINGISIEVVSRKLEDELVVVHVRASDKTGRTDEDFGAVTIAHLTGEARANAILKAITKAKRRVTLSISGLGFIDETEVDDMPVTNRVPTPISAAAELDAFAAAPEPTPQPPEDVFGLPPLIGRTQLFTQSSYRIEPEKLLDGTAAWNQWAKDMLYVIAQAATDTELDKLSIDNKDLLAMLRRSEHEDGYRKILDAAATRRAELKQDAGKAA